MKLFTSPGCGPCNMVKMQLKEANIEVKIVDTSTEEGLEQARNLKVDTGGRFFVPLLLIGGLDGGIYGPNPKQIMEAILEEIK